MPAPVIGLSEYIEDLPRLTPALPRKNLHQLPDRIVELVHHALLERYDGVVRDRDPLGTHLGTTLRDVAVADALRLLELRDAVGDVERVHLQCRNVHEEARPDELLLLLVLAQHVADVLAQKALDAFPEFLHPIHVALLHAPGAIGRIGRPRCKALDALLHAVIPRHIGHQILDARERVHRLDGYRLAEVEIAESGHAHEARLAVDLRGTRPALAGLAVPSHGEIVRLFGLNLMDGVEHDHARRNLGDIVAKRTARRIAAPHAKCGGCGRGWWKRSRRGARTCRLDCRRCHALALLISPSRRSRRAAHRASAGWARGSTACCRRSLFGSRC